MVTQLTNCNDADYTITPWVWATVPLATIGKHRILNPLVQFGPSIELFSNFNPSPLFAAGKGYRSNSGYIEGYVLVSV